MSSAEVNTFTKSIEPMGITMDGVTALLWHGSSVTVLSRYYPQMPARGTVP